MKFTFALAASALIAVASAQVPVWGQCGGNGHTGPTNCASGSCCVRSNEWYSQCQPCGSSPPPSNPPSSPPPSNPPSNPPPSPPSGGGVTTTLPQSAGVSSTNAAIVVSGSFNGGMRRYERSPRVCQEQTETGERDAMFILQPGATLSNVIIGASSAEGVHCRGTCTLNNVWWTDVCEDAATFKQTSGTSYVNGGGAFGAEDKIFQFNGRGTVSISNFFARNYGKIIRNCGNCSNNGGPRHVTMNNVIGVSGGPFCAINVNYGDTCRISNSCQNQSKWCDRHNGVSGGGSSPKIGTGPDNRSCFTSSVRSNC